MDFSEDPRRAQIEPMHNFLEKWARWGRYRPIRHESMTYKIMCWVRDHLSRVAEIREGIVLGQPIHCSDDDCEKIAWKVEHYMILMGNEGYKREREILRIYYLKSHPALPIGKLAKMMECKPWQVEQMVKEALYRLSTIWSD